MLVANTEQLVWITMLPKVRMGVWREFILLFLVRDL